MKRFKQHRILIIVVAVVVSALILGVVFRGAIYRQFFTPTSTEFDIGVQLPELTNPDEDITIIAENLHIPWEIAFLPNDELLVTERSGSLIRIGNNRQAIPIEGVEHIGEGGLLGLALHPDFNENNLLYLYLTTREGDGLINRVERYQFIDNQLSDKETIISGIPGARFHDGGRIAFGPDDHLYITTGDALDVDLAQDTNSLAGKILRIRDDGAVPSDNPFNNEVYSFGHRNPQGLTWDEAGQLWSTEHGASSQDELNLIQPGNNYGWPIIEGDAVQAGLESPIIHSGTSETWAPAGMAYYDGSLFFAGLRGESLYEAVLQNDDTVKIKVHFREDYGRLRAVTLGPDNHLYISTSNTDDRGIERTADDKIIRVNPQLFR